MAARKRAAKRSSPRHGVTARDAAKIRNAAREIAEEAAKLIRRRRRTKRNAPLEATPAHITRRGVLMSRNVLALTYYHALSKQRLPYKHEFGPAVEMWAQPDGSILLRHPSRRLWEDRNVSDKE